MNLDLQTLRARDTEIVAERQEIYREIHAECEAALERILSEELHDPEPEDSRGHRWFSTDLDKENITQALLPQYAFTCQWNDPDDPDTIKIRPRYGDYLIDRHSIDFEINLPARALSDPSWWDERRAELDAKAKAKACEAERKEREAAAAREQRERSEFERLKGKFGGEG